METWQEIHITKNLPTLLEYTEVHTLLLAELKANDVLENIDVENINAKSTKHDKANWLYDILMTRSSSYNKLVKALRKTNQTGALDILLRIPNEELARLRINFLGNVYHLKTLVGDSNEIEGINCWLWKNMNTEELLKIHDEILRPDKTIQLIRETIPPRYYLYIPRRLSRRLVVDSRLFENVYKDKFVFKNIQRAQLRSFVKSCGIESSTSQLLQNNICAQFILLDNEAHWTQICAKVTTPVHLIRYEENTSTFLLETTSGGSNLLNQLLKDGNEGNGEFCSEDEFVDTILEKNVKGVCICDLPGMGKSLLLANIAHKTQQKCPGRIVAYIQLRNFMLDECQLIEDPLTTILQSISTSVLASRVLGEVTRNQKTKFEILFDGLDEVHETQLKNIMSLFQKILQIEHVRIYVTTRPLLRSKLIDTLGIIPYDIEPFNKETQCSYVTSIWLQNSPACHNKKLSEYASYCLQCVRKNLIRKEQDFAGVPLQCRLIAEAYAEQAAIYCETNLEIWLMPRHNIPNSISEMYTKYLKKQLGDSECNFLCMFQSQDTEINCSTKCQVKSFHVWQALQTIYPKVSKCIFKHVSTFQTLTSHIVSNAGLLIPDKNQDALTYEFVHRTIAEYLVAEYIARVVFAQTEQSHILYYHDTKTQAEMFFTEIYTTDSDSGIWHRALSEHVVAYFLNSLLSNVSIDYGKFSSNASLNTSDKVLCPLEAMLRYNFQFLLEVFINLAIKLRNDIPNFLLDSSNLGRKECFNFYKRSIDLLQKAAIYCNVYVVQILCDFYFQVFDTDLLQMCCNVNDPSGSTFKSAVRQGNYEVVLFFLTKRPIESLRLKESIYYGFIYSFLDEDDTLEKKLDVAQQLFSKCPDLLLDATCPYKNILEIDKIHLNAIKYLVKQGENICVSNDRGETILHLAANYMSSKHFFQLAEFLFVDCKAEAFFMEHSKWINYFAEFNFDKIYDFQASAVILMLRLLGTTNVPDECKRLTNHVETYEDLPKSLMQLLQSSFYESYKKAFELLFRLPIRQGETEIADILLLYDSSLLETGFGKKETVIFDADANRQFEMIKFLASKGVNILAVNFDGATFLHKAAESCPRVFHACVQVHREVVDKLSTSCSSTSASGEASENTSTRIG